MAAVIIRPPPGPSPDQPSTCPWQPSICQTYLGQAPPAPRAPPASRHNEMGSLEMVRKPGQRFCPLKWLAQWLKSSLLVWLPLLSQQVSEIWNKYLNDRYQVLSQARIQQIDLLGKRFETDTGLGKWQFFLGHRVVTSFLLIHRLCLSEGEQLSLSWGASVPSSLFCRWANWDRGIKKIWPVLWKIQVPSITRWAAIYGVTQSWTRLKGRRGSSSNIAHGLPRWH